MKGEGDKTKLARDEPGGVMLGEFDRPGEVPPYQCTQCRKGTGGAGSHCAAGKL